MKIFSPDTDITRTHSKSYVFFNFTWNLKYEYSVKMYPQKGTYVHFSMRATMYMCNDVCKWLF